MVDNLFSQIIPLTAAMAMPFPVMKATRYLLGGKPFLHSMVFILTWGVTIFLVLCFSTLLKAYLFVVFGFFSFIKPIPSLSGWVQLLFGSLFIGMGVRKLKLRLERDGEPVAHQPLEITPAAIVTSTLKTQLFNLKNTSLLGFIVYLMLNSGLGFGQALIGSTMLSLAAMIWVSMPLFVYFLTGRQKTRILERLKEWLLRNGSTLIIFIYIFVGISILSSGIGALLPYLLERIFEAMT